MLEGPHLVAEALAVGLELEYVLATPDFLSAQAFQRLLAQLPLEPLPVDPGLLNELCDADSPRGLLAVVSLPRGGLESIPVRASGVYLFVDAMQDPGNLGALVRVAEAFSATAVALAPGSTHPNHPRALRASAGSLLRVPIAVQAEADELDRYLSAVSPSWLALVPTGGIPIPQAGLDGALILAVGAEGPGLTEAVEQRSNVRLSIPLEPPVESLNSTVAAAIALYEIRRQRS